MLFLEFAKPSCTGEITSVTTWWNSDGSLRLNCFWDMPYTASIPTMRLLTILVFEDSWISFNGWPLFYLSLKINRISCPMPMKFRDKFFDLGPSSPIKWLRIYFFKGIPWKTHLRIRFLISFLLSSFWSLLRAFFSVILTTFPWDQGNKSQQWMEHLFR